VRDGGDSNGVGWTQLTYFPIIEMAEDRGGAHLPGPNIDVPFVDFETPWAREGHIAFCLGNGPNVRLLQSFARSCSTLEPGLNVDLTVAESHDGGYYTHYIPREKIWD
jgi:hypothetical protein